MRVGSVIRAAAYVYGVDQADLVGPRREHRLVVARQAAMYVARRDAGASYPEIGRCMGGRDHTTALHGYRVTAAAVGRSEAVAEKIQRVADLAKAIDERRDVAMRLAVSMPASEVAARAPSVPVQTETHVRDSRVASSIKAPASGPFKPVADPVEALAKLSLDRYPIGSRVWCEIQHARFFQHMGMPYTPSVHVFRIGGVVHGV